MSDDKNIIFKKEELSQHYYGDQMRRLFFFAAFIIIFTYPFLSNAVPMHNIIFVILCSLLLVFLAGLTSPLSRPVMVFNTALAFFGVIFFEYNGLLFYSVETKTFSSVMLFALSHIIAISFFFAFYYGLKTLRWMKS